MYNRVLLVNPPESGQDGYSGPPLGLLYLAGAVRSMAVDVQVLDGYLAGWHGAEEKIHDYRPDVVGVSCLTPGRHAAIRVLETAKKIDPKILTVMGGAHASIMWRQILSYYDAVDLVVIGEGEETIRDIIAGKSLFDIPGVAFRTGKPIQTLGSQAYYPHDYVKKTRNRRQIKDLDNYLPAWDLIRLEDYPSRGTGTFNGVDLSGGPRVPIMFGRGCVGSCSFCSSWWLWHGYRHRTPESMMRELEYLYRRGARHFYFVDDSFTVDREAVIKLCDHIIDSGMRIAFVGSTRSDNVDPELLDRLHRAGCYELAFGIESGSQRILDHIGKGSSVETGEHAIKMCKTAGIRATALIIVGSIGEDTHTVLDTVRFLARARPDGIGCVGGLWLLPGTRDYMECKKQGLVDDNYWLEKRPVKVYNGRYGRPGLRVWNTLVHHYDLLAPLLG